MTHMPLSNLPDMTESLRETDARPAAARLRTLVCSLALVVASSAAWSQRAASNTAPVINGSPATTVAEGVAYAFTPTASDADGNTLRFSITDKPTWASFDSSTGKLSGTPSLSQAGVYANIVISVTDMRSKVSMPPFTITVTNTNSPPVLGGTPSLRVTAGMPYLFEPTSSDADGDVLTFTSSHKPSWSSLSAKTGKLYGTPPVGTDKLFTNVKISVSDGKTTVNLPWFNIDVAPAVGRNQPRGVYSLDRVVDKPYVQGVVVRVKWADLEPTEGSYDFSEIDDAIRAASAVGQSVSIVTLPNFEAKVASTPDAVFADAGGDPNIVPWNETMLLALEKLVKAQAAHTVDGIKLGAHPAVKQVNASIGGVTSVRLLVQPPGYTYDKFTAAVQRSLDFWQAAFPTGPHLYVGFFHFNPGNQTPPESELMREFLLNRYDGVARPRIHFFQEFLTGIAPSTTSPGGLLLKGTAARTGVMLQACGAWERQDGAYSTCAWAEPLDSPLLGAELAMREYGVVYLEFYPEDLVNPAYVAQFESIKSSLDAAYTAAAALAGQ
jgi:Putative Ig domain/Beta-galactosidase